MTKLPCHDLLQTSGKHGKHCGGNRYKMDWIPDLCPGCEQVAVKKLAERKKYELGAVFESAETVLELLRQSGEDNNTRKPSSFLDLYR